MQAGVSNGILKGPVWLQAFLLAHHNTYCHLKTPWLLNELNNSFVLCDFSWTSYITALCSMSTVVSNQTEC